MPSHRTPAAAAAWARARNLLTFWRQQEIVRLNQSLRSGPSYQEVLL